MWYVGELLLVPGQGFVATYRNQTGLAREAMHQRRHKKAPAAIRRPVLCKSAFYYHTTDFSKKLPVFFHSFQTSTQISATPYRARVKFLTAWSFIWYTRLCST